MRRPLLALAGTALVFITVRVNVTARSAADDTRPSPDRPSTEVGVASWYGAECGKSPTASGEPYNLNGLTAAHRTLPLGTWIRVTNLQNDKTITLRVNDRGPAVRGRVLDVTSEAARILGFRGMGVTTVQIEVISLPVAAPSLAARARQRRNPESLAANDLKSPGCESATGTGDCSTSSPDAELR